MEQKKRALQAKEALQQEHLRNVEADKQSRETERAQAKARRIVEAQRAQQRAALDLQQKTAYFQVLFAAASMLATTECEITELSLQPVCCLVILKARYDCIDM